MGTDAASTYCDPVCKAKWPLWATTNAQDYAFCMQTCIDEQRNLPHPAASPSAPVITGPSLWQFAIALGTLYLAMQYLPYGYTVGLIILLYAVLTANVGGGLQGLLNFVQFGHS